MATGRRVIHLGFADAPLFQERLADGTWFHAQLAGVAGSLVGLDVDAESVATARELGFEAYEVDLQDEDAVSALALEAGDVVLAGEIIEHLDSPGRFLRAVQALAHAETRLVITTPNCYRPLNFIVPVSGSELIHPDHVAWHSPKTLSNLLERNGWRELWLGYYQNSPQSIPRGRGLIRSMEGGASAGVERVTRLVGRRWPYWSDGLIATASLMSIPNGT